MKKLKQTFAIMFLFVFAMCGFLAGCNDKYKNLKVTCDKAEEGITLFVGEEELNTTDVVFDVSGAGDGVSTKLSFSFEKNEETRIVEIIDTVVEGSQTTLTLKALNGGETTLVALNEEGNKSCRVKINCVVRATDMQLNNSFAGVVVAGGQPIVLDTSKIITFTPKDTTQNTIEYSLKTPTQFVEVTPTGLLTVGKEANVSSVVVVAKNIQNPSLPNVEFTVRVIQSIDAEDILLKDVNGESIENITLVTNRDADSEATVYVEVATSEEYVVNYYLADKNGELSSAIQCAEIRDEQTSHVVVGATDVGSCTLVVEILVESIVVQSVSLPIGVIEIASEVYVNQQTEDFADSIYTKYNNGLGKEYKVEVGSEFANDKRYILVADGDYSQNIKIVRSDGRPVVPAQNSNGEISGNYDILENGTSFYVTGLEINNQISLAVVAYGSLNFSEPSQVIITFDVLLGAENIEAVFVDEEISKETFFVEVGNSIEIGYETDDENASTKGLVIETVKAQDKDVYFSAEVEGTENPKITITGLKEGIVSVYLMLPNQVQSKIFTIQVYRPLTEMLVSVESPLQSKNIAVAKYNGNQLESFVMSLGVGTQLMFDQIPELGTLFGMECQSDNEKVVTISNTGYVISSGVGETKITVTAQTLENVGGKTTIKEIVTEINVTVYVPIRSIRLSANNLALSYKEDLNKALFEQGAYQSELSLSIYPSSVNLDDSNLNIYWSSSNVDFLTIENTQTSNFTKIISATRGDQDLTDTTAFIEVFVSYYGTTFSQKCVVNITRPVRAQGIITSVDNGIYDNIYFDGRENLASYNGALQTNGVTPAKINAHVYPNNTTDKTVSFSGYDESIVYVTENGEVYPLRVGRTSIIVTAQDSIKRNGDYVFATKEIEVVVADGQTEDTALRISNERDFANLDTTLYYYLSNDILLTNGYNFGEFSGQLDGKEHIIYGINFDNANHYLFEKITGTIKNTTLTSSINLSNVTGNLNVGVLTYENAGTIDNVNIQLSNFVVKISDSTSIVNLAGIATTNSGRITNSTVNGNIDITVTECQNLIVGMMVAENSGVMLGNNNNYSYSRNQVVNFSATGKISVIGSPAQSQIGGLVGVNNGTIGSNNNGAILGKGFAVDVQIVAENSDNVGGIAGTNNGTIQNALVYASIKANQNVGGVAGLVAGYSSKVYTSIVELYQNVYEATEFFHIIGSKNVGGVVGSVADEASVENSYVFAYNKNCTIGGADAINVGGVVGFAENATIALSSANATLVADSVVGGLIGEITETAVENSFSRGSIAYTTGLSGKMFGKTSGNVTLTNSYSTIADAQTTNQSNAFVGEGTLSVVDSYHLSANSKTETELKSIDTFVNWSIGTTLTENNVWYLNETYNDGYPTIRFGGYVQAKKQATKIFVNFKQDAGYLNETHNILVLNTNTTYTVSDLVFVSTDSTDSQRIVLTSNIAELLNENNYSEQTTTLFSKFEGIAEITFMLYSNISVQQKVKVLFVNSVDHFEFGNNTITIKVGTSERLNGFVFNTTGSLLNSDDYYFGVDVSDLTNYEEYFTISNSVVANNILFFQSSDVLTANNALNATNLSVRLFKKVLVNEQEQFVQILNDGKAVSINIILVNGATEIDVDIKNIEITVINTIKFNVTVKTDDPSENVTWVEHSETSLHYIGDVLDLELIEVSDLQNNAKVFTYQIQFNEEYKLSKTLASKILTSILFTTSSNNLQTAIQVTAKPQNLLKVDILHFPAGKQTTTQTDEGTKVIYNPSEIPSNTLTPGQIGLLAIDMYPSYAHFDEIQLSTSVDNRGNYISFIQTAEYDADNDRQYIELKPNPEIIENGIILSKQSVYTNSGYIFNGTLYVKTLIGSNIPQETVFVVTLTAINYLRNANGEVIYGIDGKPQTKIITFTKNIDIVVAPNPDIKLEVVNAKHGFVLEDGEYNQYNLIARGTSVDLTTTIANFKSNVNYFINYETQKGRVSHTKVLVQEKLVSSTLTVSKDVPAGTKISVQAYATKTLNGIEEYYYSQILDFVVVDFIFEGVEFANGNTNILLGNNETTALNAKLVVSQNVDIDLSQQILDVEQELNGNQIYWDLGAIDFENDGLVEIQYNYETGNLQLFAKAVGYANFGIDFHYYYDFNNEEGENFVITTDLPVGANLSTYTKADFLLEVVSTTTLDKPLPIYDLDDFLSMTSDNDYILMADLTLENYLPTALTAKSFDGNCKTITINSFAYSGTETEYLGLFSEIGADIVVKNVFVNYQITGDVGVQNSTQSIMFGGLTAQNSGIVSNCVITFNQTSIIEQGSTTINNLINFLGENNIVGGFVGSNSGIITYSKVTTSEINNQNVSARSQGPHNFFLNSSGSLAGFTCTNSNIISNSVCEYLGLQNTASRNTNTITAGFVGTNTGNINSSYVVGQLNLDDGNFTSVERNRAKSKDGNGNFAKLISNGNIAGFVYSNSGSIRDTFSNIPMDTQARTSGFVFRQTQAGSITASYTVSYYDGTYDYADNTAHTAFVGTNELGEVLCENEDITFSYYVNDTTYIDADDDFKQYAASIANEEAGNFANYVGFDHSSNVSSSIWTNAIGDYSGYELPVLRSVQENNSINNLFTRTEINGIFNIDNKDKVPYVVATAEQFLNINEFNSEAAEITNTKIRLINNINFANYQNELQKLQSYIFVGDLDGNGMTISGVRVSGSVSNNTSSFGLFKQVGAFEVDENNQFTITRVRNLTLQVEEFARSTSTFTGILSGIITNTALSNVTVDAENFAVLGKNIAGGVAGVILGESTLYNVSANVSVESSYLSHESEDYQKQNKVGSWLNAWSSTSTKQESISKTKAYNNLIVKELTESNSAVGYAGGIAGVIDIIDSKLKALQGEEIDIKYDDISVRGSNLSIISVSGGVNLTAEKVGGLFGYTGKDVFMANSQFVVSSTDNQKFNAYYSGGGLVAENYGVIYLSKVEVESRYARDFDMALTNTTGSSLFASEKTNPVYLGGLVGESYGGYISTSYSKTNVIHLNASYAGGLIGYATNNGMIDTEDFRPTKLMEVYTTGNVFAGANYIAKGDIATSNNVAGGIFGLLEVVDVAEISTNLLGVEGLNGFYKPTEYTVPTNTHDGTGNNKIKYSDVATGYEGTVELSDGSEKTTTYTQVLGAFAGKIDISSENKSVEFENSYKYMFDTFVYNNSSISVTDCSNVNGKQLSMVAVQNGVSFTNYNNYVDYNNSVEIIVSNETTINIKDENKLTVAANNAYLLYRGENALDTRTYINYANYKQNLNSIFFGWQILSWEFNSPVYPKLIQGDTTGYIDVDEQSDLRQLNGSHKVFRLIADIYLDETFTSISSFNGTFIGAKRDKVEDGEGIGNDYYCIYNININEVDQRNNVGFIQNLGGTIQNINFVFGTNFDPTGTNSDSYDFDAGKGINVSDVSGSITTRNIGSVAGSMTKGAITGCNVYFADGTGINVKDFSINNLRIGGVAGYSTESVINNTKLHYGNLTHTLSADGSYGTTSVAYNPEPSQTSDIIYASGLVVEKAYIGGVVGYMEGNPQNSELGTNNAEISMYGGISIDLTISADSLGDNVQSNTVSVGGFAGKQQSSSITYLQGLDQNKISINVSGIIPNAHIGGIVGESSDGNVTIEGEFANEIISNVMKMYHNFDVKLNVGGVVGYSDENNLLLQLDKVKTTIQTNGGYVADLSVGGAVGYASSLNAEQTIGSASTITPAVTINTIYIENSISVGGFVGNIENYGKFAHCVVEDLSITFGEMSSTAKNVYVGGFAGQGSMQANNCYAHGIITTNKIVSADGDTYYGGFVGQILDVNTSDKQNPELELCVADVKIIITNTSSKLHVNAFSGIDSEVIDESTTPRTKEKITNCVALGDIEYKSGLFTGLATGFVDYPTYRVRNCYTMSTLKLVSNNISNSNVLVDFKDNKSAATTSIYFSYNLSGSVNYRGANDKNLTYLDIAQKVRELLVKTSATTDSDGILSTTYEKQFADSVLDNYTSLSSISEFIEGTKINPIALQTINTEQGIISFDKEYYVADTESNGIQITIYSIDSNIIANSSRYAIKLKLPGSTLINDIVVGGIEFTVAAQNSSPIGTNRGYIFNCLTSGNITYTKQDTIGAGFVRDNSGLINASGTIVEMCSTTNEILSGFVYDNKGIISNCFANGIIQNLQDSGIYSGFAHQVSKGGIYQNSYASTTMFNATNESKTYGFMDYIKSNGLSKLTTIENCYYDNDSTHTSKSGAGTFSWNSLAISQMPSGIKLATTTNKIDNINLKINYGLPAFVSFANVNLVTGTYYTSNNTETTNIKNAGQFKYYFDNYTSKNNIVLNILTNIDFTLIENSYIEGISNYKENSQNSITIQSHGAYRLYTYTLYGVNILGDTTAKTLSLISSNRVTLTNVGLHGKFVSTTGASVTIANKTYAGLYVDRADSLSVKSSFASFSDNVQKINKVNNFGIFAGYVNKTLSMDTCFASGEYKITALGANDNYYGGIVGYVGQNSKVANVFASGKIILNTDLTGKNSYVGGLFGKLDGKLTNSYSNVSIVNNIATNNRENTYVGAICGESSIDFVLDRKIGPYNKNLAESNVIKDWYNNLNGFAISYQKSDIVYANLIYKNNNTLYSAETQLTQIDTSHKEYIDANDGYGVQFYEFSVLYDPQISLVDKFAGFVTNNNIKNNSLSFDENRKVEYATFHYDPFTAKWYDYDTTGHLPVQSTFQNSIISTILKLGSSAGTTASKMSPTALKDEVNEIKPGTYYLTGELKVDDYVVLSDVNIYGHNQYISYGGNNENYRDSIFANSQNVIITDASIKFGSPKYIFSNMLDNCYLYNIKTDNTIIAINANDVTIDNVIVEGNGLTVNSGMVEFAGNIAIIDSTVKGKIKSANDNTTFGGFISTVQSLKDTPGNVYLSNCVVYNLKVTQSFKDEDNKYNIGGLFGRDIINVNVIVVEPQIYLNIYTEIGTSTSNSVTTNIGGISPKYNKNIKIPNTLPVYLTIDDRRSDTNDIFNVGLLFGQIVDTESEIKIDCSIGYGYVGLSSNANINFGSLAGYVKTNYAIDLSNFECLYYPSSDYPQRAYDYNKICFGGIIGYCEQTEGINSQIKNAELNDKLIVSLSSSGTAYIGGIVGYIKSGTFQNFVQSGDVNVTDNSYTAQTYVGGFAGWTDTAGGKKGDSGLDKTLVKYATTGTSTGLVAGLSYAKSSINATGVQDARTFGVAGKDHYGDDFYANYRINEIYIPLVVGGLYGFYNADIAFLYEKYTANGVSEYLITKPSGSVRALLANGDTSWQGKYADWNDYIFNEKLDYPYFINTETLQCRAGTFAGLTTSNSLSGNYANGHSAGFKVISNKTGVEVEKEYYFNLSSVASPCTKYSTITDSYSSIRLPVSYGDRYWQFNNSFGGKFYVRYDVYDSPKTMYASESSINISNIFATNENEDFYITINDFNGDLRGNGGLYYVELTNEFCYMNDIYQDLNYDNYVKENIGGKSTVFAGYVAEDGVTYDHSVWFLDSWGERKYIDQFGYEVTDTYFYFAPTEHWAGSVVGGVVNEQIIYN